MLDVTYLPANALGLASSVLFLNFVVDKVTSASKTGSPGHPEMPYSVTNLQISR